MAHIAVAITLLQVHKIKGSTALVIEGEVGISIIYNGQHLAQNEVDLKTTISKADTQINRKPLQLLRRPPPKTIENHQPRKKIHLDHQRNYKWRIKETAGSTLVKQHRVMINREQLHPNSALPSNPKLLLRLQLNLLQISHPSSRRKDLCSLRTADHHLHIPRTSTLTAEMTDQDTDRLLRGNFQPITTVDIPTTANNIPTTADRIDLVPRLPRN